jgi:hypothetical protein
MQRIVESLGDVSTSCRPPTCDQETSEVIDFTGIADHFVFYGM